MAVPALPPELVAQILASLPLSPSVDRAKALRAASLVSHAWRELAQKELGRHIVWAQLWPGRVESLLGSPSAAGGLVAESITLRRAPADDLWALLRGVKSVRELALYNSNEEDAQKGRYGEVPLAALASLKDLQSLSLNRIHLNIPPAFLPSLTHLHLGPGAFHPAFAPALLLATRLHTLTLDLSSHRAIQTLAHAYPSRLATLRTLELTDSYLDQAILVPTELLACMRHLTGLTTLRLARYYPPHLDALLSTVSAPLESVRLHVYLAHATVPSLGRVLRRAAGFKALEGVRKWEVVVEAEPSRWAGERGWEDEDWREWQAGCEGRGATVEVDVADEFVT